MDQLKVVFVIVAAFVALAAGACSLGARWGAAWPIGQRATLFGFILFVSSAGPLVLSQRYGFWEVALVGASATVIGLALVGPRLARDDRDRRRKSDT